MRGAWRFGDRWQLATGVPYTDMVGAPWVPDLVYCVPTFGEPFGERYETAHQLDVRVERTWQRRGYKLAVFADLGNVYRRPRMLRWQYSEDYSMRWPISDLMPLPSLGVRGEF